MNRATYTKKGYVLIESLVAATIIVVGLMGIFSLLSQSLGLNRVISERYAAAYLAAEGVEIVKNIIDNNIINGRPWNYGLAGGEYEADDDDLALSLATGGKLLFDNSSGRYSYAGGDPTGFVRKIIISQLGGSEELKVNSVIDWVTRGNAQFQVDLESRFFNWR